MTTTREAIGTDLRRLREESGVAQQAVADVFGWNRDAVSKIERGVTRLSLIDYLRTMDFLREVDPDHPGVVLAAYYRKKNRVRA
jgi:transcriptional regulator with XRE-family HTH domain